jgi:hypothetical protein
MQRAAHAGKPKRRPTRGAKAKKPPAKPHNVALRRGRQRAYQLDEVPIGKRPPRKSSRRSEGRLKTDSTLRITAMNRNARPATRATRRSGNPN